jgi:hypothetical protein
LLIAAALAAPTLAAPIALPHTKATLDVPATWTKVEATGVVVAYKSPSGLVLAVTRAAVPNPDAWRSKTRDAYVDQIERGALAAIANGKRRARKVTEIGGVPVVDLELSGARTIVMRIVLFRSYALTCAIEVGKAGSLDEARIVARSFKP